MQNRLFRRSALERLSSPERLDLLMQVTSPQAWLALLGVLLLLVALVTWGFVGSIPVTVAGQGIFLRGGAGITSITAPTTGLLNDLYVSPREQVESGQVIGRIVNESSNENIPILATFSGRIIEILVSRDDFLRTGSVMMTIEPISDDTDLEAILYLPAADGKKVQPGMAVQLVPDTVRAEESGVMLGWVVAVGEFPESQESVNRVLENDNLTQRFFDATDNTPIEVRVQLVPDRHTISGYRWTTPAGPDTAIRSGTLATATIILSQQPPVRLIFSQAD
ncbi:MAG: NHLP bacteriocin system secretion protein [Anaerolineae bacterium]|nr:NHLP bacteriocin system secretion protein [Anaerolineae bacterium]